MFKTVNKLLNKSSNNLPDCTSPSDLAGSFSDFFTRKINRIRDKVDNIHVPPYDASFSLTEKPYCSMSSFQAIAAD